MRKSFLHSNYVQLIQESPNFLILQHNNLLPREAKSLRTELKAKVPGSKLQVIRGSIFHHALKVYESIDRLSNGCVDMQKVNLIETHKKAQKIKLDIDNLFVGPLAIFTLGPKLSPEAIRGFMSVLKGYQNKILLLGIRAESKGMDPFEVENLSKIPSLEFLQSSLLSVLSSPASQLRRILDLSKANVAYTLERREPSE